MSRKLLALMVVLCSTLSMAVPVNAQEPASDTQLLRELDAQRVARHAETGKVRFLGASLERPMRRPDGVGREASAERAARAFMARNGTLFGVRDQARELAVLKDRAAGQGRGLVRFEQRHRGVPVMAGQLNIQLDAQRNVLVANGEVSPDLDLDVAPAIAAAVARQRALDSMRKRDPNAEGLQTTVPQLWIYDPRLLGTPDPLPARLVWRLEVRGGPTDPLRQLVLVDARSGAIALSVSQLEEAKTRYVCDNANAAGAGYQCTSGYERVEGGAATNNADVDRAYDYAGITYDYFKTLFGRDSLDGAGLALRSTVRYCPDARDCPYANAFWTGAPDYQMVYGAGYAAADDVVGHELAHGLTNFESNLFYLFQSGAINEALSDIFGEFIDQKYNGVYDDDHSPGVKWLMGEDIPGGAIRSMSDPAAYDQPDSMTSPLYDHAVDDFGVIYDSGGVHINSGVANKAAYLLGETAGTIRMHGDVYVTAIGTTKSAWIWYEVETNLLTSGSDYADLYLALQQACYSLIGTAGISPADCAQVKNAADAVDMDQQPTDPLAQAPEAALCPAGGEPQTLYYDGFESTATSMAKWTPGAWTFIGDYAGSGATALYGEDGITTGTIQATVAPGITLPAGAYLHLRHSYQFEYEYSLFSDTFAFYDGGVLQYNTGPGWTSASSLVSTDGLPANTPIAPGDNPLASQSAFAGWSSGFGSSRVSLAGLAGSTPQFRFQIGTDTGNLDGFFFGWVIDDVRIYTCGANGSDVAISAASDSPDPVKVGDQITYSATARNNGPQTASTTLRFPLPGSVTFLSGAGCTHSGGTTFGGRKLGGTVACSASLASGASLTKSIKVGVVSSGSIAVKVSAAAGSGRWDPNLTNNARWVRTTATYPTGQTARCSILGSDVADTLTGTSVANVVCGFGGNDTIDGLAGNDTLNGGPGVDRASYTAAAAGVIANLTTGLSSCNPSGTACGQGADKLIGVEDLAGGAYADKLTGSTAVNKLYGNSGNDLLYAGAGNDRLFGLAGNDTLYGQTGTDYLDGGTGTDGCPDWVSGETKLSCP